MDNTDWGVSLAAFFAAVIVLAGAFFDLLQSGLQIIGIGTAVSLVIGTSRFLYERKEVCPSHFSLTPGLKEK